LDVLKAAKEELINSAGDLVDQAVFTALKANANAAATGTRGAQTCYGGDARAESELAAGDTISTDMVADAKRKLMSTTCKFWVPSSPAAEAVCSVKKNPWSSDPSDPFTTLIAPEQENIFLKDSQFVNAAEYGGNEIVMNGEVGKYLGIKILVAPNTPAVASGGTALDGGSVAGTAMHRAIMLKGKKAAALAWGQRPKLRVFPFDRELETDLVLEMAYQAKVLHTDAMVFLDVADE
jgi:N4-gp56 family major capsid protein